MQYFMYTSGITDDVMFADNGASGAESKATVCLVEFARWRHWVEVSVRLPYCSWFHRGRNGTAKQCHRPITCPRQQHRAIKRLLVCACVCVSDRLFCSSRVSSCSSPLVSCIRFCTFRPIILHINEIHRNLLTRVYEVTPKYTSL